MSVSSLSIPHAVWRGERALLADAPWCRGRAALFAEVRKERRRQRDVKRRGWFGRGEERRREK